MAETLGIDSVDIAGLVRCSAICLASAPAKLPLGPFQWRQASLSPKGQERDGVKPSLSLTGWSGLRD